MNEKLKDYLKSIQDEIQYHQNDAKDKEFHSWYVQGLNEAKSIFIETFSDELDGEFE